MMKPHERGLGRATAKRVAFEIALCPRGKYVLPRVQGGSVKVVGGEIIVDLVDIIAEEIYRIAVRDGEPFCVQAMSCKAFYRRIARWHLKEVERHVREEGRS